MPEQSSLHVYLNWAKERIDEMDAALASFEAKATDGWSGRRESNPRMQLGKLPFCH